ncbi:MAG: DUF805 domain-containing protein [Pseudomonadota bacterium]
MVLAVTTALGKYAEFKGRASRAEFWWLVLAIFLVSVVIRLIETLMIAPLLGFQVGDERAGQPLSLIFSLAILLPAIAVTARRLHDIGKSAWWLLIGCVPVVGAIALLWLCTRPSDAANDWGEPNPLY